MSKFFARKLSVWYLAILLVALLFYGGYSQYQIIYGISAKKFFNNVWVRYPISPPNIHLPPYPIRETLRDGFIMSPLRSKEMTHLRLQLIESRYEFNDPGFLRGRFRFFSKYPYTIFTVFTEETITNRQADQIYHLWQRNHKLNWYVVREINKLKLTQRQKTVALFGYWNTPIELKEPYPPVRKAHLYHGYPLWIEVEIFPELTLLPPD